MEVQNAQKIRMYRFFKVFRTPRRKRDDNAFVFPPSFKKIEGFFSFFMRSKLLSLLFKEQSYLSFECEKCVKKCTK